MNIEIVVFEGPAWEPESAVVYIGMLQTMVDSIPAEHRANARIEYGIDRDHGGGWGPTLRVSYFRPETPTEERSREDESLRRANQWAQQERLGMLAQIAKYQEPKP